MKKRWGNVDSLSHAYMANKGATRKGTAPSSWGRPFTLLDFDLLWQESQPIVADCSHPHPTPTFPFFPFYFYSLIFTLTLFTSSVQIWKGD